ncbi:hypothetical protein LF296_11720 [Acinetobacter vivianii]|uniref:Uncharacterized protein n=1 Tax=Acinetobacter vivianii TaxID=1776742 RepID=A0AAJ6NGM5_9GAMM|nr:MULTISPECIES: hypothetical protein [Acinetobacter]MBJ9956087.1 hypothetical protein [Acinetobacter courvalinii]MCU4576044.1 hypothetical protein [Acinetobacter courvalinii]MCU4639333.1 hypothetical protein [Acinetobacter courvalinii]WDZ49996.1 hypothetical protein LF296_11720 [Acinetobacter vivianii]
MTFYIGGHMSGSLVETEEMDKAQILKPYSPYTGIARPVCVYARRQISFQGTVKSFYILETEEPIVHRDQILALWDQVETDIYVI